MKGCPFCGSNDVEYSECPFSGEKFIECYSCGILVCFNVDLDKEDVLVHWDTRSFEAREPTWCEEHHVRHP